jgi:glycosyltransferase involved in cell wall biosynthesis
MEKKKILIVSASFYPQNSPRSFRTTELAKEFSRLGHSVIIITTKIPEIHAEFEKKHNIVIKDLGSRKWKSITLKGKGIHRLARRFVLRFSMLLFEYPNIELFWMVKKALEDESGYDLLISIAVPYPVHWGVAASRTSFHKIAKTWVADCGDPYMGRENDTFKVPFYFGFIENWFMRKTDFVSVPTIGSITAYYPEFHKKIRVISQGFRFEDYNFESNSKKHSRLTFAYAGMFIPGRRDPTEFIKYLLQQDIDFEFHIYTKTPDLVTMIVGDLKSKIIVHDSIPREELLEVLSRMDFLVNFENAGSKQTPSKLIDYLILGKPILSVKTGSLNTRVIREFLNGNYEGKLVIDDQDQYRIENVCEKFLQLVY